MEALWREMNRPVSRSVKRRAPTARDGGLGAWLTPPSTKNASGFKPPRLDEAAKESARASAAVAAATVAAEVAEMDGKNRTKRAKLGTGLEAVLQAARNGDVRPTTLDRTKENWREFKKGDADVTEELEAYKKDKNRYTDKVAFLDRSSQREWEVEQAGKKTR